MMVVDGCPASELHGLLGTAFGTSSSLARVTLSIRARGLLAQDFVDRRAAQARLPGDVADRPPLGPEALDLRLQFGRDLDPPALLRSAPPEAARPGGLLPGQDALRPDLGLVESDRAQHSRHPSPRCGREVEMVLEA